MKSTSINPEVDQFIINVSLIDPISKILTQLSNREFRDCDIKWLDGRLEKFTSLACETLGFNVIVPCKIDSEAYTIMNAYVTERYLHYFSILLSYFRSF